MDSGVWALRAVGTVYWSRGLRQRRRWPDSAAAIDAIDGEPPTCHRVPNNPVPAASPPRPLPPAHPRCAAAGARPSRRRTSRLRRRAPEKSGASFALIAHVAHLETPAPRASVARLPSVSPHTASTASCRSACLAHHVAASLPFITREHRLLPLRPRSRPLRRTAARAVAAAGAPVCPVSEPHTPQKGAAAAKPSCVGRPAAPSPRPRRRVSSRESGNSVASGNPVAGNSVERVPYLSSRASPRLVTRIRVPHPEPAKKHGDSEKAP